MQLAREAGREIMKVDISQSESMWFGENEKIIKRIFTEYRSYAGECERIPIFLFNEADGILVQFGLVTAVDIRVVLLVFMVKFLYLLITKHPVGPT